MRRDLDTRRHAAVVKKLTGRIARTQLALAEAEPMVDTTPLDDPAYVSRQWDQATYDARRSLLRLAWAKITIAKAGQRGGHFDPNRISYAASVHTAPT